MGLSYEEYLAKHPVSPAERAEIDAHKLRMLTDVHAWVDEADWALSAELFADLADTAIMDAGWR